MDDTIFYHGTKADLQAGDLIAPGHRSNYGSRRQAKYVYFTGTMDAAIWGAELAVGNGAGRIYTVEPTGPCEDDPNLTDKKFPGNPTRSFRTQQPLRVTGGGEGVGRTCARAAPCDEGTSGGPETTRHRSHRMITAATPNTPTGPMSTRITVSTLVDRPVREVWHMWTAPEHITQWCAASDDWHCPAATNDPRTGGRFSSTMAARDGSFSFDFEGVYDDVQLHERIAYTMPDGRTCELLFAKEGGGTRITETFDAETQNSVEMQQAGWQSILDRFKRHAETTPL